MHRLFREGCKTYSPKIVQDSKEKLEIALGHPLTEFTIPETQEFTWRMKDIEWTSDGPSRALEEDEQKYIANERLMCQISFRYWLERYCKILTAHKKVEPMIPWPSQEALLKAIAQQEEEGKTKSRIILLKSRQIGGTAFSQALVGHMIFHNPRTQGLVAADHPDITLKLYQTLDRIYAHLPGWLKPTRDWNVKGTQMRFPSLDCDIIYGSGNQKTTMGQGLNLDVVHLTEVSTWIPQMCSQIDGDLMPAFDSSQKHHSLIILESTGAGAAGNWFHDQFQSAVNGTSLFKPVFIAWYLRPGWRMDPSGLEFTPETKAMAARVKRETGLELDREQMAFYQLKRRELESKDMLSMFYQEFPSTVEEAFQTGLKSVFSIELRSKMRDKVKLPIGVFEVNLTTHKLRKLDLEAWLRSDQIGKENNKLIVWEWARKGFVYNLGVDASYGMTGKDAAAIEVLRVGNKWEPDEQVAEFRGTVSPLELSVPAQILGSIYRDPLTGLEAQIVVEVNPGAPGLVTQLELQRMGYPHFYIRKKPNAMDGGWTKEYGWYTTAATRPLLTEMGVDYLRKGDLVINSPFFIKEMDAFVVSELKNGRKKMEHAPGYHDDRIISLFMCLFSAHDLDMSHVADDRRRTLEQMGTPTAISKQFHETGDSWDVCMSRWEASLVD